MRAQGGIGTVLGAGLLVLLMTSAAPGAEAPPAAAAAPESEQRSFESPQAAVEAMIAALEAKDTPALLAVLGSDAPIDSGDPVADDNARQAFLERYREKHEISSTSETKAELEVGSNDWPFPIPLVRDEAGWYFDTEAGAEEILDRRVGRNERDAIQACLAYTDAQSEYYLRGPVGEPLRYAQKFASTPGQRDGLYWPTDDNETPSPLGEIFAAARAEGYAVEGGGEPFHGYYFKILTAQGPQAMGGAYDYVAGDAMIGGFALVAYPAEYGESGVMTFTINHDNVLYEKDLGLETEAIASAMKEFNPDSTWKRVTESEEEIPE